MACRRPCRARCFSPISVDPVRRSQPRGKGTTNATASSGPAPLGIAVHVSQDHASARAVDAVEDETYPVVRALDLYLHEALIERRAVEIEGP